MAATLLQHGRVAGKLGMQHLEGSNPPVGRVPDPVHSALPAAGHLLQYLVPDYASLLPHSISSSSIAQRRHCRLPPPDGVQVVGYPVVTAQVPVRGHSVAGAVGLIHVQQREVVCVVVGYAEQFQ